MSTYKAVIVDDEEFNFDLFKRAANDIDNIEICCCVSNPFEAVEKVREYDADIVFTDIEMPGLNGIELAERLIGERCIIVFLTAFSQYALEAFRVNAMDYIMKPVMADELKRVVNKIDFIFPSKKSGSNSNYKIKINVFGHFEVYRSETKMDIHFLTSKSEELFYMLLLKVPGEADKATLCDILWPDMEPEKAAANLYTAFYRLKKTLSEIKEIGFSSKNGRYSVILNNIDFDLSIVKSAEKTVISQKADKSNIQLFMNIINIYKGPLLEDKGYIWLEPLREEYNKLFIKASFQAAEYYSKEYVNKSALSVLEKLFKFFPFNEKACLLLCEAYEKEGNKISAVETIHKHVSSLKNMLDMKPSKNVKLKLKKLTKESF